MNYYIAKNNEKQGPYTEPELAEQHITSDTLVWTDGMESWQKAGTIPALAPYITVTPQQAPVQPKSYLVQAILVTFFCCLPFGIVGIVKAATVSEKYNSGRYEEAEKASKEAKKWTSWSFYIGLAWIIISTICCVIGEIYKYSSLF